MKTNAILDIYEVNGKEVTPLVGDNVPKLEVKSHWNRKDLVVIVFYGKEITVSNSDLSRALSCAEKAHKF